MVKQIRLKRHHFNNVDDFEISEGQFCQSRDCPVFRALKEQGINVKSVDPTSITLINDDRLFFDGGYNNVEACRKRLLDGAKYVIIPITQN